MVRLSGTGTEGATVRVYLEQYQAPGTNGFGDTQSVLAPVRAAILELCNFGEHLGRTTPDVVT